MEFVLKGILGFAGVVAYPTAWVMFWFWLEENGNGGEAVAILCWIGFAVFIQPYITLLEYLF
jgi:hypothetical protein